MRHLFPDIFASFLPKCGRPSAAEPPALAGGLIAWSTVPACWSPWPQLPCGRPPASIFRQARPGHICSALLLHVFQITADGICCYGSPHRGTLSCASLLLVHKKVTAESLHSDSLFFSSYGFNFPAFRTVFLALSLGAVQTVCPLPVPASCQPPQGQFFPGALCFMDTNPVGSGSISCTGRTGSRLYSTCTDFPTTVSS